MHRHKCVHLVLWLMVWYQWFWPFLQWTPTRQPLICPPTYLNCWTRKLQFKCIYKAFQWNAHNLCIFLLDESLNQTKIKTSFCLLSAWIVNGMRAYPLQCSTDKTDCRWFLTFLTLWPRHSCPPVVINIIARLFSRNSPWFWCSCLWFSLGPLSSILVNKYGSRPVMMAGGCLSGLGLIGASFCNSVQALYFCIGVVGGTYIFYSLCTLRWITCLCFGKSCHQCIHDIKSETSSVLFFFFFFLQVWDWPLTSTLPSLWLESISSISGPLPMDLPWLVVLSSSPP